MDNLIFTYLLDIRKAIVELEGYFEDYPMRYDVFEKDYLRRSAVERKAEIMGEAMNRIHKLDPNYLIPNARGVIDTRNRIIHAYDSVKPEFLWGLVIRHIPELKKDIERLIKEELAKGNLDPDINN